MPNIKISSGVSQEHFLELSFVVRYLAKKLKSKGVEFVLTREEEPVVPFSGSSIFVYGFSGSNLDEQKRVDRLIRVLKDRFAIPIFPIKSNCFSLGEIEAKSPYLQIMCGPKDDYLKLIKDLRLGCDAEFHLVNSNISLDDSNKDYAEIILTPNEAQLFGLIIEEFGNTSFPKDLLRPKIIMRFVSRDELN